ncbi:MAG TPA: hypothetical protein ENJ20_07860 [Bacteroidetes bacterium]|nr:hypothetical protein [Bacteroidota bacterium]
MKNQYFLILILFLWVVSCETPNPYQYDVADFIELKKDPCFGFCPVYTIKINGRGEVVYNGLKNVEKEGTWYRILPPERVNGLFSAFEEAGFWDFNDEYTAQVTDLPTTWITLVLGEKTKTIKDYYGAPEKLKTLEAMIGKIVSEEEGWKRELSSD